MERTTVADVDSEPSGAVVARHLSAALDAEHVAINLYRIPPGDGFPSGLHAHMDQEEVFIVLDGEATFETGGPQSVLDSRTGSGATGETLGRRMTVGEGEAIRFAPGEFQTGLNESDEPLVALALGAPRDSEDVRLPLPCPSCGHDDLRLYTDGGVTFVCPGCSAEHVPAPCPDCGSENLGVRLGAEGRPVVSCGDCEATFENPPLQG